MFNWLKEDWIVITVNKTFLIVGVVLGLLVYFSYSQGYNAAATLAMNYFNSLEATPK